jgi:carboxyl-terminal processing protease
MPRRSFLILLIATAVSYVCYARGDHDPYCRYVASGLAAIREDALDPAPSPDLFDGAMQGMVDVLRRRGDPHSQFLNAAEAGPLRNEIHQQFGGIGVRIGFEGDPPQLKIVGPIEPNTPAGRAKLLPGDRILQIDGQPTAGMNKRDVLALLVGEPSTSVRLTIRSQHESQARTIELVRDVIEIDSILGDRHGPDGHWLFALEDDPRIAQIRIVSFGDRTALEFATVLPQLLGNGVRAIVLDLRDNAGGSLGAAVAVCEMLLPAGKMIVETRGRGQTVRQTYSTKVDGKYYDLPVTVIVNQNSASAAEIVAACLQDHRRAVVVGQQSFGKGTVQQLLPLGKSLLKLTWASFRRPSGANIHHTMGTPADAVWGVMPDTGYEHKLSPDEYAAYTAYRDQRDGNGDRPAGGDAGNIATAQSAKSAVFVDEPLRTAEHHLQAKLDAQP